MTTRYFKIENESALAAWDAEQKEKNALYESTKPLADRFGGKPLFSTTHDSYGFAGLRFFGEPENPELWTKPQSQNGNTQRPRTSLRKATKEQRQQLAKLQKEWDALYPKNNRVDRDPLYKSIGTHWGQLVFSGLTIFRRGDCIYAATSAALEVDGLSEITGSEFDQAMNNVEQAK